MKIDLNIFSKDSFPPHLPVVYKRDPKDREIDTCESFFRDKSLIDINAKELINTYQDQLDLSAIVSWLSPEAFVFFLPGLISAVYERMEDDSTQLPLLGERIALHLLDYAEGQFKDEFQLLIKSYSRIQLAEFSRFLINLRDLEKTKWHRDVENIWRDSPFLDEKEKQELLNTEIASWEPAARALDLFWGNILHDNQ